MARTVSIKVLADMSQYVRGMGTGIKATRDFKGELEKAATAGKLDHTIHQASMLGLGLVGVAGAAVKMAADFDKQMSAVQAATHSSAVEMTALRKAALQAGADTKFSATEAAQGIEELAKAGVSTKDILSGGLKGALDLAAAGNLSVGEAAETAASAMTQFKLKGSDVPHVADLLAAAAGKAQGDVHDMGQALSQAGLVANQMGLSVEDTTGTLAAFASAGLMGSDAGTSLKQMMLQLENPTSKSRDLMADLGLKVYDARGQFIGITGLAQQLQTKLKGLTQEQRNAALAQIFGSDAIRSATVLYDQGAQGIQGWINKTNDAGYAAETARIKTDNLAGDVERLTGSVQTLAIESGSGANSGLRILVQAAEKAVDTFGKLPPVIGSTITVAAALSGGALLLGAAWLKTRRSTAEMLAELRQVGPNGERAATALEKTKSAAGKAAAAFVLLQTATAIVSSMQGDLNPQIEAMALDLAEFGRSGQLAGESARVLGGDMKDLEVGFKFLADGDNARRSAVKNLQGGLESIVPGLEGTNTSLARTKERIAAMDGALSQLVSSGRTGEAKAAFDRLAAALAVDGVSMDEFRKQFPQYSAAIEVAGGATKTAAGSIDQVGGSAADAADKVEELVKQTKDLFDVQMSLDQANIAVAKGWGDLRKELTSGRRSLSLNSEAGQDNRTAVLNQVKAVNDLREARVKHGESLDSANVKYNKDIAGLRKVLLNLGYDKTAVDKLIGSYKAVPAVKQTKVSAPGLSTADKAVKAYDAKIDNLAREVKTKATFIGPTDTYSKLQRLLVMQDALKKGISVSAAQSAFNKNAGKQYASGGRVSGPGTDTSDSIDARLSNDEYVIRASSARRIGYDRLDEMNEKPDTIGFAAGGRVQTWAFPTTSRMTRIPSRAEALGVIVPAAPSGGRTDGWIEKIAKMLVPGIRVLSKFRPGAMTLTGNRSYHSMGRAVDFQYSEKLARLWNERYKSRTKELISPYQQWNIHNGERHRYTGAVWNQHNFAGGNPHDHIAMKNGGTIKEPVFGVGASGRTYSFGENGIPEHVISGMSGGSSGDGMTLNLTIAGPVGSQQQLEDWLVKSIQKAKSRGRNV